MPRIWSYSTCPKMVLMGAWRALIWTWSTTLLQKGHWVKLCLPCLYKGPWVELYAYPASQKGLEWKMKLHLPPQRALTWVKFYAYPTSKKGIDNSFILILPPKKCIEYNFMLTLPPKRALSRTLCLTCLQIGHLEELYACTASKKGLL